ncbi:MAG: rod shape-determining protein MreC [bacterium]|nr:rod shape-determining protein MreC [bacterium]
MNYPLIRNVRSKSRFGWFSAPLFFLVVIILFHFLYPKALGNLVSEVALPFWNAEHSVVARVRTAFAYFSSKATLEAEVERLTGELLRVNRLLLDRDLLLEENALLKKVVGRDATAQKRILGAVLVAPPRSPYDSVMLDVGSRDGVISGARVFAGSVALGSVSVVYSRTSLVTLFSTAGSKTPVLILHEGLALPVESVGQGGGEFIATLPKETSVSVGDAVVIPGLPPIPFAKVEAIVSSATDSFEVVRFKNPFSFSELRFLEVERPAEVGQTQTL